MQLLSASQSTLLTVGASIRSVAIASHVVGTAFGSPEDQYAGLRDGAMPAAAAGIQGYSRAEFSVLMRGSFYPVSEIYENQMTQAILPIDDLGWAGDAPAMLAALSEFRGLEADAAEAFRRCYERKVIEASRTRRDANRFARTMQVLLASLLAVMLAAALYSARRFLRLVRLANPSA